MRAWGVSSGWERGARIADILKMGWHGIRDRGLAYLYGAAVMTLAPSAALNEVQAIL